MKRYKELNDKQKKNAVDFMFQRLANREIYRDPKVNKPDYIAKRLKEIQEEIKFCGCKDCFNNYSLRAYQDSQVKEWILIQAIEAAESAYYPEDGDNIIKVN